MKKFLKFVKKNRVILSLLSIIIVCLIICLIFGFKIFWGETDGNEYGTRLDGLDKTPYTETEKETIKTYFLKDENVDSVKFNLQGKIMYITINFSKDLKLATAKKLVNESLKEMNEEIASTYDIQFILTTSVEDSKIYPTMGYKAHKKTAVSWINS